MSGRYDSFIVTYYSAGRRKRESFSDLARARGRANEIARAIINDRLAVVELSNADREGYVRAIGLLRPLGIPLHSAIEEYLAARSLLNGQPLLPALQEYIGRRRNIRDKPVAEIVDELLESRKHALRSNRYIQTLRSHLSRFAVAFQTNISSITTGMIEDWLVSLKLGPCGRNNVRCSLVTFFHFARSRHYLPKGEATEADDIPKAKDRGGKIGILRPQELAKLLSEADAESALYLALRQRLILAAIAQMSRSALAVWRTSEQQKQIEALTAGLQKVSAQLELNKPAPQTVVNNQ